MTEATKIYRDAHERAERDHLKMVDDFMAGRIDIAQPCFHDRLKDYLIAAFDAAFNRAAA